MPSSRHEKAHQIPEGIKFKSNTSDIHSFSLRALRDHIFKILSTFKRDQELSKRSLRISPNHATPENETFSQKKIIN